MNSLINFFFMKEILNKNTNKIERSKPKSPKKSVPTLVKTKSRNKSIENFTKFQWSWTL